VSVVETDHLYPRGDGLSINRAIGIDTEVERESYRKGAQLQTEAMRYRSSDCSPSL